MDQMFCSGERQANESGQKPDGWKNPGAIRVGRVKQKNANNQAGKHAHRHYDFPSSRVSDHVVA